MFAERKKERKKELEIYVFSREHWYTADCHVTKFFVFVLNDLK